MNQISHRTKVIRDLLQEKNPNEITFDLIVDVFQNLLLDLKSIAQCKNLIEEVRPQYNDFNVLKVIGQGAFGQVQLVRHRETGILYALKILNKAQMIHQEGSIYWMLEREIMTQINSRWIVHLVYAFQDPKRLYMAMEYLPGGTFSNWLSELDTPDESDVRFYAAELVLAINAIHEHLFVHRDIKPDNILVDIHGHLRLSDFGSCVRLDENTRLCVSCSRAVGTPDYISPEVLQSQGGSLAGGGYGCEVDWWAFGVLIYEIYYGTAPFFSDTLIETYSKIMAFKHNLNFQPDGEQLASDDAVDLIKHLICDQQDRLGSTPGAQDLKDHKFFARKYRIWNWDNIHEHIAPFIPQLDSECDTSNFESVDDEETKQMHNKENCRELSSKVFSGENLQFSGFSFTPLTKMIESVASSVSNDNNNLRPNTVESNSSNDHDSDEDTLALISQLGQLTTELQDAKNIIDKLTIEKHDIENVLESEQNRANEAEEVTYKLQKNYTDLMTKHGQCDKVVKLKEEEKQKLIIEIDKIKESNKKELNNYNEQVKDLENKLKKNQKEYEESQKQIKELQEQLLIINNEQIKLKEKLKSNQGSTTTTKKEVQEEIGSDDSDCDKKHLNKIIDQSWLLKQTELNKKIRELQLENDSINGFLKNNTNELIEERRQKEIAVNQMGDLKRLLDEEKKKIMVQAKEIFNLKKGLDDSTRIERGLELKIARLLKVTNDEKSKYEDVLENQKLKYHQLDEKTKKKISELEKDLAEHIEQNEKLQDDLRIEKTKCGDLVVKIEQIITGKSSIANEMMMKEKERRGLISKKEKNQYLEASKQNKKLQRMMDDQQRRFQSEKEALTSQIDYLNKEIMQLEEENQKYRCQLVDNTSTAQGSEDQTSENDTVFTNTTFNNDHFEINNTFKKPPVPSHNQRNSSVSHIPSSNQHHEVTLRTRASTAHPQQLQKDSQRLSSTLNYNNQMTPIYELPSSNLDLSIRRKGKKINWERRIVKLENDQLNFYDDQISLMLSIPFSCILFIRVADATQAIHVKPSELPRVFYITYDRVHTLHAQQLLARQYNHSSTLSLHSPPAHASDNNTMGPNITSGSSMTLHLDDDKKSGNRRSSLSRLMLPMLKNRNRLSTSQSTNNSATINNNNNQSAEMNDLINNPDLVMLKGHALIPLINNTNNNNDKNSNFCAICHKSLINNNNNTDTASSLDGASNYRTIIDKTFRDLPTALKIDSRSASISSGNLTNDNTTTTTTTAITTPEYYVDITASYICSFCHLGFHGNEVDQSKMFVCQQSVAMQLFRTKTTQERNDWVNKLSKLSNQRYYTIW